MFVHDLVVLLSRFGNVLVQFTANTQTKDNIMYGHFMMSTR